MFGFKEKTSRPDMAEREVVPRLVTDKSGS
jgi:hypothetical protein